MVEIEPSDILKTARENREDIIRIQGDIKLIHPKLDNHMTHLSKRVDTIYKIVWTGSIMVLGLLLRTVYTAIL